MKYFKTQIPQNNPFFDIIAIISIIWIGLIIGGLLFWSLYFFHEYGHVIVAFGYNLLNSRTITGHNIKWAFLSIPNNWIELFTLLRPVQANVTGDHWIIGLGGIISPFIFSIIISIVIFIKTVKIPHKFVIFSIPLIILPEEVIMNCLCGFDCRNITLNGDICSSITPIIQEITPILLSLPIIYFLISIYINKKKNQ